MFIETWWQSAMKGVKQYRNRGENMRASRSSGERRNCGSGAARIRAAKGNVTTITACLPAGGGGMPRRKYHQMSGGESCRQSGAKAEETEMKTKW
jgi:hypothetical protein